MPIKNLWFMDVTTERYEGRDVICVWMLDNDGKLYSLYDFNYKDWIYISGDPSTLKNIQEALAARYGDKLETQIVNKRVLKDMVEVLYISGDSEDIQNTILFISDKYRKINFYEDDIRFSNKYLLKNDISPSSWYMVKYDISEFKDQLIRGNIISLEPLPKEIAYPKLRVLSLDMITASPVGDPDPNSDPIFAISIFYRDKIKQYVYDGGDREILESIINDINSYNPHIIVTFEGNTVIWPYLLERGHILNIPLNIGIFGDEPHQSLYGHFSIPGRLNIDLKEYVDINPIFQKKTLEELSIYVGIPVPDKTYDRLTYYDAWKNEKDRLLKYNMWRAEVIYKLFMQLKEEIFSLSSITGMPADYVLSASTGYQVENYIMRNALKKGNLIIKPGRVWRGTYMGGLVYPPREGLHKDVCVIDFKSMYPMLIVKYNVSPDTITTSRGDDIMFFDEINVGVVKSYPGLFPEIIKKLVEERDNVRLEMKRMDEKSSEYKILDAYQKVLKIMANAMYGYMGWIGARYYNYEGAQLVTYLGRETISKSREIAESLGLTVLYGDTDSLFVNYIPQKIRMLLEKIGDELELEAKIDRIYKVLLFTEAKKRYAGLTDDDKIDIVGLEYVRRDWCEYAKETQYELIKLVLKGATKEKLLNYFRERVIKLDRGEVPIEKLIIWEQITKKLDEYKAMSPHLAVAEELSLKGWKIKKGMFIGYIILRGAGPLYKRAVHYTMARKEDIDWDYYIYRQLIPVAARILEPIGVSKSDLESIASGLHFSMDRFLT